MDFRSDNHGPRWAPGKYVGNEDTRRLLQELRESMTMSRENFVFACGGSVPIGCQVDNSQQPAETTTTQSSTQEDKTTTTSSLSSPIPPSHMTLRWDSPNQSTLGLHCKLDFPIEPSTSGNLAQLVADMSPATFGLGGKDVYDESYRKALKLDPSHFALNFSPYDCGIIDSVAQILLPDWKMDSNNHRGVRAELYKLNIYTGPSGHFRAHVDTPRSESQFGSLVVCLPVAHEGGQLEVRHNGKTISFDWSQLDINCPSIQWAAFYSDCEHEVFQVRSGHRITLTYNLYATRGSGQLTSHPKPLDLIKVPLYTHMHAIIGQEKFMPKGGYLGFYTTHSYPHTTRHFCEPDTLKGLDMAIWECFQALGCSVYLRPVAQEYSERDQVGFNQREEVWVGGSLRTGETANFLSYDEMSDDAEVLLKGWSKLGDGPIFRYSDIAWLNDPGESEFQFAYLVYGNEASINVLYSVCAIVVEVPPYEKRVEAKA
ncbi:putative 2og-fe oxygenase family protein [Daldinia childiae]|uniref:putative 2og-fe oxygenase family protein n=1 Tax=Daldinia childiae TaxID=326645 RepID=UPI0014462C23|nr:putative 2og-fe oxygenase family protein [Daldinia childiae]KAF3055167.1 putative 2og-fe oxygenase family protein [Daldinia childiae]